MQQWAEVIEECRLARAGSIERLHIALLNVNYVTIFELPFRLLLVRAPQLIARLSDELQLSQKNVVFNGKRFGCVFSVKADLSKVPDEFQYRCQPVFTGKDRQVRPQPLTGKLREK